MRDRDPAEAAARPPFLLRFGLERSCALLLCLKYTIFCLEDTLREVEGWKMDLRARAALDSGAPPTSTEAGAHRGSTAPNGLTQLGNAPSRRRFAERHFRGGATVVRRGLSRPRTDAVRRSSLRPRAPLAPVVAESRRRRFLWQYTQPPAQSSTIRKPELEPDSRRNLHIFPQHNTFLFPRAACAKTPGHSNPAPAARPSNQIGDLCDAARPVELPPVQPAS